MSKMKKMITLMENKLEINTDILKVFFSLPVF